MADRDVGAREREPAVPVHRPSDSDAEHDAADRDPASLSFAMSTRVPGELRPRMAPIADAAEAQAGAAETGLHSADLAMPAGLGPEAPPRCCAAHRRGRTPT